MGHLLLHYCVTSLVIRLIFLRNSLWLFHASQLFWVCDFAEQRAAQRRLLLFGSQQAEDWSLLRWDIMGFVSRRPVSSSLLGSAGPTPVTPAERAALISCPCWEDCELLLHSSHSQHGLPPRWGTAPVVWWPAEAQASTSTHLGLSSGSDSGWSKRCAIIRLSPSPEMPPGVREVSPPHGILPWRLHSGYMNQSPLHFKQHFI